MSSSTSPSDDAYPPTAFGIPPKAAERALNEQVERLDESLRLVARSLLPAGMKTRMEEILRERTATLA